MSVVGDRGVDVELLADEIDALRMAAHQYTDAVVAGKGVDGAGLDLEAAAVRYVRKLDDEHRKANAPDYLKIVEEAEAAARDRGPSDN